MSFLPQVIFLVLLVTAAVFFFRSVKRIWGNIKLGLPFDRSDKKSERIKQMVLVAFGQKKMFKRPVPAFLHLLVYAGFLIVNMELLEIVLDGLLGKHRIFEGILGGFYPYLINFFEFFAVAVLLSCVIFLIRRNVVKIKRFHLSEMTKWPKLDGNLILIFEIVLMLFLLNMNATDSLLMEAKGLKQSFFFSDLFKPLYGSASIEGLHVAERFYWWAHIIGICFFANYVPYSKHLHIFLAFPNTYWSNLELKGKMVNMDTVTKEVKLMLGMPVENSDAAPAEVGRFGAKDVKDLSQKNLLDAYACTECGRCTSNCPANLTGKTLSPRKIMMDTRDRLEEYGKGVKAEGAAFDDGKSLLGDYITEEEIFACTTCNACTEACPVNIDPMNIITELRRFKVMEEAQGPSEWNGMYQNIETSFNPWKFPPSDRKKWTEGLKAE